VAGLGPDEFGALFARHARLLWVVAASFVPRTAVDDVLQDAAATALARLHQFAPGTDFRAWMTQIVRHTATNHGRRQRRLPAPLDTEPMAGDPPPVVVSDTGKIADHQATFDDAVVRALEALSFEARACLLLQVVLGASQAEIGTTLGIPEGTVASHVHRARRFLRRRLGSAAAVAARPSDNETSITDRGERR